LGNLKNDLIGVGDESQKLQACKRPSEEKVQSVRSALLEEFKDVFSTDTLKVMTGEPMTIKLKENYTPFAVHGARPIPYAWRDETHKMLLDMEAKGIISPVGDRHVDWCSPMVVVQKPNGKLRLCVDFTKLNDQCVRPLHPICTPTQAVETLPPKAKYFSVMDAVNGYWQLALAEDSRDYTCFITPWGRFVYNRSPAGFVATGDSYNLRGDRALEGLENVAKVVDDICAADETFEEHVDRVRQVLQRCRKNGITLSREKFVFAQPEVKYVGFIVSEHGTKADPEKMKAIRDSPKPTNRTELKSFMGMVTQLSQFSSDVSKHAVPLREAQSLKNEFVWTRNHANAFNEVKKALVSTPILARFDPTGEETVLQTDASRTKGLGFALLQKQENRWRIIMCGSRYVTDTESRYAMCELECLAIVWAVKKCRLFLAGIPRFTVITDHRPLIPILNSHTYTQIENARLLRYRMALSDYVFHAEWRKGKDHSIPDALSRAPVRDPYPGEAEETEEVHIARQAAIRIAVTTTQSKVEQEQEVTNEITDAVIEEIRKIAADDEEYQKLVAAVEKGTTPPAEYKKIVDELSTDNGIVLFGQRIIIPRGYRRTVISRLHDAHQGIERIKRRARQCVFWSGISSDLKNAVDACESCQERRPSLPKEPIMKDAKPERVFEIVSCDLFTHGGKTYLVYSDRLSGFPMLAQYSKDPSAPEVAKTMIKFFITFGVPSQLRSDGGPQFKAKEFQDFLLRWGVTWTPSSPYMHCAHAEANVRTLKNLVAKSGCKSIDEEEFQHGLLELRNSPRSDGRSSAQIVFGHPLRSKVPMHPRSFAKEWQISADDADKKAAEIEAKNDAYYNRNARRLRSLELGMDVLIQDPVSKLWTKSGKVVSIGKKRDYRVVTASGQVYWRNRKFLRPKVMPKTSIDSTTANHQPDDDKGDGEQPIRRSGRARKKLVRFQAGTI